MRYLLSLFLVAGISFACDLPYEDIRGYKVGCPIQDNSGLKLESQEAELSKYSFFADNDIYYKQDINTINGNIEEVRLVTDFDREIDKNSFISKLDSRWGGVESLDVEGGIILGSIFPEKSDVIGEILVFIVLKDKNTIEAIDLTYRSNKMMKYQKTKSNQDVLDSI